MRPHISFVVSKLSRFVANPGDDHWHALERVIHYIKPWAMTFIKMGIQEYLKGIVIHIGFQMLMR
jgi:hypothetical protein